MDFLQRRWSTFLNRLGTVRDDLRKSDIDVLSSNKAQKKIAGRRRSSSIVFLYSCLENFVDESLRDMYEEVESKNTSLLRLDPSIIAVSYHNIFKKLSDTDRDPRSNKHDVWDIRQEVSSEVLNSDSSIGSGNKPLDGSIIKGYHFDHLWQYFGFPGPVFPRKPYSYKTILRQLALDRNELCHGSSAPTTFGIQTNAQDLLDRTDRVEEVCEHLALTILKYIDQKQYLR